MRLKDETGSASVELALVAPSLLILLAVMLAGARLVESKSAVASVAREVARAAAAEPNLEAAIEHGDSAGRREASALGLDLSRLSIVQAPGLFERGARYSVTVSYGTRLSDLPGFGLFPKLMTVTSEHVETVERYKSR
jgi:hypothetical protein